MTEDNQSTPATSELNKENITNNENLKEIDIKLECLKLTNSNDAAYDRTVAANIFYEFIYSKS